MPLKTEHFVKAFELIELYEKNNTLKQTAKGASVFGISVFACSLCLGPVGALCGGVVGGLAASAICNEFDSLSNIWKNKLSNDQREEILRAVNKATEDVSIEDAKEFLQYLKNNPEILANILNNLRLFGVNVSPTCELMCSKVISHVG